jgi:putative NIF3 family GTP cyclohydrolase 1 type 2
MCGGSAAEFMPQAIERGAQAYITADCKLNQFLDLTDDILLIDSGHFETEQCTKEIFYRVISEKFPNFAVCKSTVERNPVQFL